MREEIIEKISALTPEEEQLLAGKCTTMAGPSGVGKSSLINLLQPKVLMETGRVSDKTLRGKHTTRRSELIPIGDDSFIVDTPGFTSLEAGDLTKEDIAEGFPEIARWEPGCRFAGCSHIKEPDCAVREKLSEGLISLPRYESYVKMYQECSERKQYR